MERLTGNRTVLSNGEVYCDLEALGGNNCEDHCHGREDCQKCPIQNAFNRLSAYEDTGLEPAEITAREEKIRQIIRERFEARKETFEEFPTGIDKRNAAAAMSELTELYSRIFNISYDKAAEVLHGGESDD